MLEQVRYYLEILKGVDVAFNELGVMDYDDWLEKYEDLLIEVEDVVARGGDG